MPQLALIGYPLGHSFSPAYFMAKFARLGLADWSYEASPLADLTALPAWIEQAPDLVGFNVTIPYKTAILPYLDEVSEEAAAVGAVNTVSLVQGRLIGYNTDVFGFRMSLLGMGVPLPRRALVLGTGGASRAVQFVLRQWRIPFQLVSRTPGPEVLTYPQIQPELVEKVDLLVQTTPLGMSPMEGERPLIPYTALSPRHLLFDLVYNPSCTPFLQAGLDRGARVRNGLEMLYLQAEKSWQIWMNAL